MFNEPRAGALLPTSKHMSCGTMQRGNDQPPNQDGVWGRSWTFEPCLTSSEINRTEEILGLPDWWQIIHTVGHGPHIFTFLMACDLLFTHCFKTSSTETTIYIMVNNPVIRLPSAVLSLMFGYKVQQIASLLFSSAASADMALSARRRSQYKPCLAVIIPFFFAANTTIYPM